MKIHFPTINTVGILVLLLHFACSKDKDPVNPAPPKTITSIQIDGSNMDLSLGDSTVLTVKHTPAELAAPSYTWSSTDPTVATVVNGKVKALKVGETTIKVEVASTTLKSEIKVKVQPISATSLSLSSSKNTLQIGDTTHVSYTIMPPNTTDMANLKVEWSSDKPTVASVVEGIVTAVDVGEAKITAKIKDTNISGNFTVTVKAVDVASVSLAQTQGTLDVNETVQLSPTVLPATASNKQVSYSSSDASIASVSATGLVTALKTGTATITVTTADGNKTATYRVTVNAIAVASVTVQLTKSSISLIETSQASATITPTNAAVKTVTWSTSDATIATVSSSGLVTGKKAGTVDIIATSNNGKVGKQSIQIKDVEVMSLTFIKPTLLLGKGSYASLSVSVSPPIANVGTLTWSSSATNIATVDASGKVTGKAVGTAVITVQSSNGKTATATVTVAEMSSLVTVTQTLSTVILVGTRTDLNCRFLIKNISDGPITYKSYAAKSSTGANKGTDATTTYLESNRTTERALLFIDFTANGTLELTFNAGSVDETVSTVIKNLGRQ